MSLLRTPTAPMPRSARVRRGIRRGAPVAFAALLLVGCNVDNTPPGYNAAIEANFIATCTGRLPNASTTTLLASEDYCRCAYGVFARTVPYNDADKADGKVPGYPESNESFQALEERAKDDPAAYETALPGNVKTALTDCRQAGIAGPKPAENVGTTVVVGTTPGTEPTP